MKTFIKPLTAIILVCAASLLLVTGCKNTTEPPSGTENNETQKNYFNYGENWNFNVSIRSSRTVNNVKQYVFNYSTVDQQNNTVTCSALLEYPKPASTSDIVQIDCVIIDCHGTIHNNSDAPSVKGGASFSASDLKSHGISALIIAPDYLGYGSSADKVHPYMITNLCARNIIDSIIPVLENPSTFGYTLNEGYKSYVVGYSQGGQTSLGTMRAVENYIPTAYKNLINLEKCYSGAGPHDLPATMENFLNKGEDGNGIVFPNLIYLVIKGVLSADYECMRGYELADFFTDEFLNSRIKAGIDAKEISISSLALEFNNFQDLNRLVKPELLNPGSEIYKNLKNALSQNSLSSGWTVTKPVYIFQHINDDMVPPINIRQVQNGIGANQTLVTCHVDETAITTSGPFDFIHSRAAGNFYTLCAQDLFQILGS
ncbi:MAG: hypothetical protein J6Y69_05615 [Treponema sp.]|nr:hypothetical protein [Treponema sp.]